MSSTDGTANANDPTAGSGVEDGAAAVTADPAVAGSDDPTRTSAPGDVVATATASAHADRLPAPLQYRDPDRYQIVGEHGRGGLGRVLRARDKELGRDVAVKELLQRGSTGELRFFREALITARLEHPGIVPVHEAGRWPDGTPFYAMKLVEGRPLRELIDDCKTMEERLALVPHVIAVADAVAYAHERRIIHRDLKPSNVIVGAFGETVVIDWGLAKDLTSEIADPIGDGPYRVPASDGLTVAGSVLGTPAYMAPEQHDGAADERSDIYALGGMLLHVVSGAAPQADVQAAGALSRQLRKLRLPRDLAAVIMRAMAANRSERYESARALSDDLRRFSQKRPVAARRYSIPARLLLGFARQRIASMVLFGAIAALAVTLAIDNHRIGGQRSRALGAEATAERERHAAETSLDQMTLQHSELLLLTDPSAAVDVVNGYRGSDHDRANQIRAEAAARGTALLRALPHSNNVLWVQGTPSGAIFTLSTDGTVAETTSDGKTAVVAKGVGPYGLHDYSSARHLLAYACDPFDVCLYDLLRHETSGRLAGVHSAGLAFSPDGLLLASMSDSAVLTVYDISQPAHPVQRLTKAVRQGGGAKFIDNDLVVAGTTYGVEFVRLDGASEPATVPDSTFWDVRQSTHELALASTVGTAFVLHAFPLATVAQQKVCDGPLADIRMLPGTPTVAYACKEGTIGTWDYRAGTVSPLARLDGHADMLSVSRSGDYLLATGGANVILVLDLRTGSTTTYAGHGIRPTAVAAPDLEYPVVLSADARGGLRAWSVPPRFARVVLERGAALKSAIYDDLSGTTVVTQLADSLVAYSPSRQIKLIGPHEPSNIFLEKSDASGRFATYGFSDVVETWMLGSLKPERVFATGHGNVTSVRFFPDGSGFVTSGHDGRVVKWALTGSHETLATFGLSVERLVIAGPADTVVLSTSDGTLWRLMLGVPPVRVQGPGPHVNRLALSRDRTTVFVGRADGDVSTIDTKTWKEEPLLKASDGVSEFASTTDGNTIAVATHDGHIYLAKRSGRAWSPESTVLATPGGRARDIDFTPQDVLVAACTDGVIWLYSLSAKSWVCIVTGRADLSDVSIAADGTTATTIDATGRIIWLELRSIPSSFFQKPYSRKAL